MFRSEVYPYSILAPWWCCSCTSYDIEAMRKIDGNNGKTRTGITSSIIHCFYLDWAIKRKKERKEEERERERDGRVTGPFMLFFQHGWRDALHTRSQHIAHQPFTIYWHYFFFLIIKEISRPHEWETRIRIIDFK